ncbi:MULTISPECIES: tripartite tricarboxylate transporter substrate binding protein [unclassified Variovorax]|uniref:Bug family tripartite tricarboxylate transporter substrate binding protein n=1 Tax=unclassified Variovorax TaxID=663243 RepID=UPI002577E918|nr:MULTISPECIES: tripartite tricarboxylate transporter substrate binding protein [unclassified Variovorax]MDM0089222.1 tripartite tricarboxylate transporter substrate binding protein [Variovorax sp. J22G40]MDM0147295.1 tripartite tricarboxylate transporter substrate binding protein [Variovorax sp. J2P1-31]
MKILKTTLLALGLALGSGLAMAQAYPSKPIRIIVPFSAGGMADALPRAVAAELSKKYGQPVVIENKPGAASMLGAEYVAKSAPDGYTLLLATSSTLSVVPHLYKSMRYDSRRDLASVTMLATSPSILMVTNDLPVKDLPGFVAYLKERPAQLSFASAGVGGVIHLHSELFQSQTGTKMIHVPYQGSNLALGDLQTGRVQMMIDIIGSNYGTVKGGKLKVLAAMSDKRLPLLPEVPSVAELGLPGLAGDIWFAISAPAKTPPEIVAQLQRDIAAIARSPAMLEKFAPLGVEMVGGTPAEMDAIIQRDGARWSRVIREADVRVE